MEHECVPPRSKSGQLPAFDSLWRCDCKQVWAVAYTSVLDVEGVASQTVRTWVPSSRLRWIKRFGLRA